MYEEIGVLFVLIIRDSNIIFHKYFRIKFASFTRVDHFNFRLFKFLIKSHKLCYFFPKLFLSSQLLGTYFTTRPFLSFLIAFQICLSLIVSLVWQKKINTFFLFPIRLTISHGLKSINYLLTARVLKQNQNARKLLMPTDFGLFHGNTTL